MEGMSARESWGAEALPTSFVQQGPPTALFPTPSPNELIFSLCARLTHLTGEPRVTELVLKLFGGKTRTPLNPLPSSLGKFYVNVGSTIWASFEEMIEHHTIMPLCRAFEHPVRTKAVFAAMRGSSVAKSGVHIGTVTSASVKPHEGRKSGSLRLCPACRDEEIATHGFARWWRSHQVPWVNTCWRHEVLLIGRCSSCDKTVACNRRIAMPPLRCVCSVPLQAVRSSPAEKKIALFYHQLMQDSRAESGLHVPVSRRVNACRTRAKELGLDDAAALSKAIGEWLGVAHPTRNDSGDVRYIRDCAFVATLVTPTNSRVVRSLDKEVLAIPFLFDSWAELVEQCGREVVTAEQATSRIDRKTSGRRTPKQRELEFFEWLSQGKTPPRASELCWLPYRYGDYLLHRKGCNAAALSAKPNEMLITVVCDLLAEGRHSADVARATKLNVEEVRAIQMVYHDKVTDQSRRAQHAKWVEIFKARLLSCVMKGGVKSRTELKHLDESAYRHVQSTDPRWLEDVLARHVDKHASNVNWEQRDQSLCRQLELSIGKLRNDMMRPRVSVRAINTILRISENWNVEKLPCFAALVRETVETVQEGADRRLRAVASDFPLGLNVSQICEKAKCGKKSLSRFRKSGGKI